MNFSEFKRLLGADPRNRDPATLAARRSGPEFEQAARDAEAFELKLENALKIDVDEEALRCSLVPIPDREASRQRMPRHWMALAASVLLMAGAASIFWHQTRQPASLGQYVQSHYRHDGGTVLARAGSGFDPADVNRVMASVNATAGPELVGKVDFIKLCPGLDGTGAHMVLSSAEGPVTVFYLPDAEVGEARLVRFDAMEARLVSLDSGAAAIIGEPGQDHSGIEAILRRAIAAIENDA